MKKINNKTKRKLRNRKKLKKVNNNRYRISVFKTLNNLSAQIIDDKEKRTLVSAPAFRGYKKRATAKSSEINLNLKIKKYP